MLGETQFFKHSGFINTLVSDFIDLYGHSVAIQLFLNQPKVTIKYCCALSQLSKKYCLDQDIGDLERHFREMYQRFYYSALSAKLGLKQDETGIRLVKDLLVLLDSSEVDYFHFFNRLTTTSQDMSASTFRVEYPALQAWFSRYKALLGNYQDIAELSRVEERNPVEPLIHHHVASTVASLAKGNRNAVENILDSMRFRRQLTHYHWAS